MKKIIFILPILYFLSAFSTASAWYTQISWISNFNANQWVVYMNILWDYSNIDIYFFKYWVYDLLNAIKCDIYYYKVFSSPNTTFQCNVTDNTYFNWATSSRFYTFSADPPPVWNNDFFLDKTISMPWENININPNGTCFDSWVFISSNRDVWDVIVWVNSTYVHVYWIWETLISDTSWNCTWSGVLLISTEDWKQPFMTKDDFNEYTNYELIFIFFSILITFVLVIWKF